MASAKPITSRKKIETIKALLSGSKSRNALRNEALFITGINTNLRASDLVRLKVGDVRYLKPGEKVKIRETKTGKARYLRINGAVYPVIQKYLKSRMPLLSDDEPLFLSDRKAQMHPKTIYKLVKGWCEAVGLRGSYGSHTLRKTCGYIKNQEMDSPTKVFVEFFNHATEKETRNYLGIDEADIFELEMHEI